MSKREMRAYGEAGAIANEVIGGIRTVTAFNAQYAEVARYQFAALLIGYQLFLALIEAFSLQGSFAFLDSSPSLITAVQRSKVHLIVIHLEIIS